ncbi:MAG: bifunctional phosphoribosylaminoimidazolecarboxamide formyltransferase/IMP cyclohydrolase [Ignavibacteriota bacterium]|nr:bifunctional phosphoribosylaminoimidazolecarboxamide formyltransferase/IMP cyclohydrolase PurH [Ignavibacteriota bacterium]MCO6447598.1 bifunctional phosphoribosylaminoimidazolecarboxamide formyltransferase/IMP cyclohydrolase [Ignavibacterium album]MCZ2269753.1 bifunctional phosphoribosylaminoimidazolecarboxamide formyltransferase/IMP cyclohydrolase [Ignavibacteriales bacterium]QKJ99357.1 MAG: bifunctional phosphoribosylaminoimidazolecarboxamide formyltransferase/IMP cyclohydrolase [Ignavibac
MKKLALISVSDKTKIIDFTAALIKNGYEIVATGNTAKLLKDNNLTVTEISSLTGFPEIFDGRVKTLHPKVFGGILFRRDNAHDITQANENQILPIDIVCVNLYPFVKTISNLNSTLEDIIENIDIGGPSLVRASAKNYKYVSILTNPEQYDSFIDELDKGEISENTRKKLAVEAFSHTANYDTHIANFLEAEFEEPQSYIRINEKLNFTLRYGENPHQSASVFGNFDDYFEVFHGKEISYNNILDLVSAVELCEDLGEVSCTIIKHNNPAGAATANTNLEAYNLALKCDPVSSFGGIVAFNREVDAETAEELNKIFLEIVCAPSFSSKALELLKKKKDRRLVIKKKNILNSSKSFRSIPGGVLAQDSDTILLNESELKFVTDKKPSETELKDLKFAWKVAKHTKSNAIVYVKNNSTLGVGAGQMSRIDSAKIAVMKAKEHGLDLTGSVAASDAFFPFADGLSEIIKYGAVSVIQPGGSVRDQEVIDEANKSNISMVFTGIRHFKH